MNDIIVRDYSGIQVLFQNDAYLNATAIAKHFGKRPQHYLDSDRTTEYLGAICKRLKAANPAFKENQLVIVKRGSSEVGGGTWLHPKLAIDFARWMNADFAVWCDEQIEIILRGDQVEQSITPLETLENIVAAFRIQQNDIQKVRSQQRYQGIEIAKIKVRLDNKQSQRKLTYNPNQIGLDIDPALEQRELPKLATGTHASPVPHERRGHYRQCRSGKRVWVRPTVINPQKKNSIH